MTFVVATNNVLADSYIKPEYFPHSSPAHLDPAWRWPALVERLAGLGADLVCLQEVERPVFERLAARFEPLGFGSEYCPKAGGKPDGCASFWRRAALAHRGTERLVYGDGTGHVALLLELEHEGRALTAANTHIKWEAPGAPLEKSHGLVQTTELVERIARGPGRAWIACGDFNARPESEIVKRIVARGLRDPFAADAFTANANGLAKKIDYIFTTAALVGRPRPLPRIEDRTPLPSASEPSDHLPVVAEVSWT